MNMSCPKVFIRRTHPADYPASMPSGVIWHYMPWRLRSLAWWKDFWLVMSEGGWRPVRIVR